METTQETAELVIATAKKWGREAADEARRLGWEGDSRAGDVEVGVTGVHYLTLDGDLGAALGRSPTGKEADLAKELAYYAACQRLDETEEEGA